MDRYAIVGIDFSREDSIKCYLTINTECPTYNALIKEAKDTVGYDQYWIVKMESERHIEKELVIISKDALKIESLTK